MKTATPEKRLDMRLYGNRPTHKAVIEDLEVIAKRNGCSVTEAAIAVLTDFSHAAVMSINFDFERRRRAISGAIATAVENINTESVAIAASPVCAGSNNGVPDTPINF